MHSQLRVYPAYYAFLSGLNLGVVGATGTYGLLTFRWACGYGEYSEGAWVPDSTYPLLSATMSTSILYAAPPTLILTPDTTTTEAELSQSLVVNGDPTRTIPIGNDFGFTAQCVSTAQPLSTPTLLPVPLFQP